MIAMVVMVIALAEALLAVEDEEVHAEGVESGDKDTGHHSEVGETGARDVRELDRFNDRVLGVETREEGRTDQGQRTDQRGDPSNRHVLAQAAHVADVLIVMHADDDRARGKEQQRLEESVRHQVEDRHGVGGSAQCNRHVSELGQRRVGNHALDVVLDNPEEAHEQRGDGTDDDDERERGGRQFEQRRHARYHEDTRGHHGRRVNQRGDRCRAFHRVRQPDMQRNLCRFTHRPDKQADTGHGHQRNRTTLTHQRIHGVGEFGGLLENLDVIQRTEISQDQADTEDEAEVTDTVDQEGLHVGKNRGRTGVPETDQQIGDQTDSFPAEEELHEVVAHHQHQHGEGEQRDVAEEAVVTRIFLHVADGVDMDHQRHEGHDQHHRGRQGVDHETDFKLVVTGGQPGIDRTVEGVASLNVLKDQHGSNEGNGNAGDGRGVRDPAGNDAAEETGNHRPDERGERYEQVEFLHLHD